MTILSCKNCGSEFAVTEEDLDLYKKVSPIIDGRKFEIPVPDKCPFCRFLFRQVFRNEINLYKNKSSMSGKPLISSYSPDKPYKILSYDEWWGDDWDATDYGFDFDFNRSFFGQFKRLFEDVPKINLIQDGSSENCEYTNYGVGNRNCYLTVGYKCEDTHYSVAFFSRDSLDLLFSSGELLYECIDCDNCYHSFFLQNCQNCRDSWFLESCSDCEYCLGCKNLRRKKYFIFNEQYSKEDYEKKVSEFNLHTYSGLNSFKERFEKFKLTLPFIYAHNIKTENSTGDFLQEAKDCCNCFKIVSGAQDCRHCINVGLGCSDLIDCSDCNGMLNFECSGLLDSERMFCCHFIRYSSECFYSAFCFNSSHLFGCVGLNRKKYCILNKQYSKEEYEELLPKIINHMKKTEEWGKFFPPWVSAIGYNESLSYEYFPLTKEEALDKGFTWSDYKQDISIKDGYVRAEDLPGSIDDVDDSILEKVIICAKSGRPFKLIPPELKFYRKNRLPLPRLKFEERHFSRAFKRNIYRLFKRECDKCGKSMQTTYSPERPEKVYCEECYLKEVYE